MMFNEGSGWAPGRQNIEKADSLFLESSALLHESDPSLHGSINMEQLKRPDPQLKPNLWELPCEGHVFQQRPGFSLPGRLPTIPTRSCFQMVADQTKFWNLNFMELPER